jgi:RNA polymerase sigma-70 factor (ECF subfamily)
MDRARDEDLMVQVQAGSLAAFEQLVERHKTTVYRLALSILRRREDAEEAAQDTFVKLFRRRDLFDSTRPLEPWLLRIAGNTCRDLLRRRRAGWMPVLGDPEGHALDQVPAPEAGSPATGSGATRQAVRQVLDELSDRHRLPLELKYLRGLTNRQIAQSLGISISNVKVRVARAKEVLQSRLGRVVEP